MKKTGRKKYKTQTGKMVIDSVNISNIICILDFESERNF